MPPVNPILASKIHVPSVRPELTPRLRLVDKLNDALQKKHRLILVSAPAGFGKTTLVADWIRLEHLTAAWVSLEHEDNDPARFWRYVITAIQTVDVSLGQTALAFLESSQLPRLESLLSSLLNDLSREAQSMLLVLDDYHVVETETIHRSLDYFLDHLTPNFCVVITTRVTPPLALARLRGRSQLTEAKTADLRFTQRETRFFLNTLNHLDLTEGEICSLEERTEGWIVGLQMAALSMNAQVDRHAFVDAFAGDDHYIMDFLLEEVLQHQAQEIETFLVRTSIIDRLTGPLCDAITGREDSHAMLARLERENLFVTCLDNRGYWYRYHQLFADLLRRRLRQTMTPTEWKALYHRACNWYEQEGLIKEAVSQALAMPDFELAADLMEKHILSIFFGSETVLVHRWLQAVPEKVLLARPLLCVMFAHILIHKSQFDVRTMPLAESWLNAAERSLMAPANETESKNSADPSYYEIVRCFLDMSSAYLALWRNDEPGKVIALANRAIAGLPSVDDPRIDRNLLRFHSSLNCNLGLAYRKLGDFESASLAFDRAREIGLRCGDMLNASAAVACQTAFLYWRGQLHKALSLCQETLKSFNRLDRGSESSTPFVGSIYAGMGGILVEWNDLEAAEPLLHRAFELSELTTGMDIHRNASVAMARLRVAQGRYEEALALLDDVDHQGADDAGTSMQKFRTRLWLAHGDLDAAIKWAAGKIFHDNADSESLSLVRVLIAMHRESSPFPDKPLPSFDNLMEYLEKMIRVYEQTEWVQLLCELLILQAMGFQALGNDFDALRSLQRCIKLAEPAAFIRLFVDEGHPMRLLLARLKNAGGTTQAYITRLLSAWGERDVPFHLSHGSTALPDLLTIRELEVLRLFASGKGKTEIARALVIAPNTVKKHISNIYGKLAVTNRADAVARAREIGLII
jgi:LuxR family maltose regulon positive regulatory protein